MRKDLFIALIKKKENFFWRFDRSAILLKEFLESPQFKKLSDGCDISEKNLKEFLTTLVVSDADSASVLAFFQDLEAQYNKNIVKEKGVYGKSKNALNEMLLLPDEIWEKEIPKHLEPKSATLWAQTSSSYYRLAYPKVAEYWQNKLVEAGCPAHLIGELIKTGIVCDYKRLYDNYCLFRAHSNDNAKLIGRKSVPQLWKLLLLSGDLSALSYVSDTEGLNDYDDEGDFSDWYRLDYIALTGNVEALKFFMEKHLLPYVRNKSQTPSIMQGYLDKKNGFLLTVYLVLHCQVSLEQLNM